ncbi:MAG: hypothetical protein IJW96_06015, partial [Clostridia bacterium]|nr:hypothetical protein [Clostridia bacterium]
MKKKILAVLGLLCSMTLMAGFAACDSLLTPPSNSSDSSSSSQQEVTYSLDSTKFEKVVAYKSTLNYNNLVIKASLGETINVTEDMVSGAVTDKTGSQTLTISYKGETFNVGYEVKYAVKFVVDGKTIDTQLVLRASEVKYPTETPVKEGDVFEGWQPAKIQAVTDNITVQAKFKGTEVGGGDENVTADIEFENADVYVREYGEPGDITFTTNSTAQGLKYALELSNQNIECEMYNGLIAVKANKAGVTELTLKVTDAEGNVLDTATKKVVVKPHSFLINKSALGSGDIEGIRTIGR